MSLKYSPYFFFGSLLYFGCNANASATVYCNILWANNTPPQAVLNATLDGSVSNTFPLKLSVGGGSTAITQYQEDIPTTNPVKGIVRYWVQYPTDWITSPEGLRYRISSTLDTAQSQIAGVKTVVTPTKEITWQNIWGCNPVSSIYTFDAANLSGIYLEIDRGAAWPGVYSLSLPIAVAYEENKGNYNGNSGGGWKEYAEAMKNHGYIDSKNIQITITSKCEIKSRALNINLGHSITPEQARVGVNKQRLLFLAMLQLM